MAPAADVGAAIAEGARRLAVAGVEDAALDARLLLGWVLGVDRLALLRRRDEALAGEARARFEAALDARAGGRPVSRIIGERWFWGLRFGIDDEVLDPRPDSETLIEAILTRVDCAAPLRLLDLGTGSGCLLLALLSELDAARGLGIDRVAGALARARANAVALGLSARAEFREGDWTRGLDGHFDVIVANPPYIASGAIDNLAPEVARHDPRTALDGGVDGLEAYRAIARDLPRLLAPEGMAALEIGAGQATLVRELVVAAGMPWTTTRADLAGIPRCLLASRDKESINRSKKGLE